MRIFGARRALSLAVLPPLLIAAQIGCRGSLPRGLHPEPSNPLDELVRDSEAGASADQDVLALGPRVRGWLKAEFGPSQSPHPATLDALSAALSEDGALGVQYDQLATFGAEETLTGGSGNCLSQTHLFVAMARALGMRATYREVYRLPDWTQVRGVRVQNRHVAARVHVEGYGTWQVDFGEAVQNPNGLGRDLTDAEARALHFNNLGGAALTRGASETALRHFNRALLLAPRTAQVWANLGTTYLRRGEIPRAEAALREAIRLDPHEVVALTTLARLYRHEGAIKLADAIAKKANQARFAHPFVLYQRGLVALSAGQAEESIRMLEGAVKGLPELMRLRADLGRAYYKAGRFDDAKVSFKRADRLAVSAVDREELIRILMNLTTVPVPAPTLALKHKKEPSVERPRPDMQWP